MRRLTGLAAILSILIVGIGTTASAQGLRPTVIETISESVVLILTLQNGQLYSTGSGTIVESTGLIYTNHHVIEGADDFEIYVTREVGELPEQIGYASLVKAFNEIDFAILQIDRDVDARPIDPLTLNLPALSRSTQTVSLGDPITVFGYPTVGDGYLVITQGTITSVENANLFDARVPLWYRTDAEISPGNSGGLVVDSTGAFLGIPTMVRSEERTLGRLGGVLPIVAVETVLGAYAAGLIPDTVSVTLNNTSAQEICYLYVTPTTASEWGSDALGDVGTIPSGGSYSFAIAPGVYDVLMQDCGGEEIGTFSQREFTEPSTVNFPADTVTTAAEQKIILKITEIEHDVIVEEGGQAGFKVHTEVNAVGYLDQEIRIGIFYMFEDGSPVSCERMTQQECDDQGNLTVQAVLVPSFEDTIWDDYWFWIPYSGLPSGLTGQVPLMVQARGGPNNGSPLGNPSPTQPFVVDFGAEGFAPLDDFIISVNEMVFDTTGDHSKENGVRTYVDFSARGHRGVPVRVALFFYWEDGTPIKCAGRDTYYCDPSGNLTVQEVVTPEYENTVWSDYWMHVPYSAFPSGAVGTHPGYVVGNIDLDGSAELNHPSAQFTFDLYYN